MSTKALLVGINAYDGAPLSGCVNDVMDMAHFIVDHCGFAPETVRLLTDGRATTKAILDRLAWLVTDLEAGDRILFHFSGHGAQVSARNDAGESDGLDEILVPVDLDWSDERMIRDDDLNRIFSRIPEGVSAVFVADCCHSGDVTRDLIPPHPLDPKVKRLPPPPDIAWRNRTAKVQVKPKPATLPNIALVSGCRSDQTSADAHFEGRANGALTYFLLQALRVGPTIPLSAIVPGVRDSLATAGFAQQPQIEGPEALIARAFLR